MDESSSYPPIDPTTFDLIIVGTGVPESIIAAAASSAGKSVLHLDPNPFYGSHFSSPTLEETVSFLQSNSTTSSASSNSCDDAAANYAEIELAVRPLISDVEVSPVTPELQRCGRFSLDVSGPRILFCADSAVDLMIKSGISEYMEFKGIDASFVYDNNGGLSRVPGSRSEIFKDRSLGLTEKTQLMRFFKLVQEHLESACSDDGDTVESEETKTRRISPEDLDSPFTEFLAKMRLPPKIKSIILYAIVMADTNQEADALKPLLKTSEAINRIALYHSSIGRFPNASSGMLYPMYGHGEVPQAFCRRAAVKGCIYVLRMPVVSLLLDKESGIYKGIKLASSQLLYSHQLVLDPCFVIPPPLHTGSPECPDKHTQNHTPRYRKVARGICITRKSVKAETSNILAVYPPKSLYPQQKTAVRALQIGSNLAVCPSDMFVLYLSTPCDDASEGKRSIKAAMDALCVILDQRAPKIDVAEGKNSSTEKVEDLESNKPTEDADDDKPAENAEDDKPSLVWSALYVQEVMEGSSRSSIISAPSPDTHLSYTGVVHASLKLFHEMYPDAELFPETTKPENAEDEDEASVIEITTISDDPREEDAQSNTESSAQKLGCKEESE